MGAGAPLAETMTRGWQSQPSIPAFQSILGDPTLRLFRITPPQNVRSSRVGSTVSLVWDPAPDPGTYYYVYRGTINLDGLGTPLVAATKLSGTSFTETVASGSYTYMVRASKLQTTGSGSFWNLSQGTFTTVTVP